MALRQAMAVCDSIRQDQVELKNKLALAQEGMFGQLLDIIPPV